MNQAWRGVDDAADPAGISFDVSGRQLYGFEGEMLAVYKLEKQNGDPGKTWPVLQTARERVYALGRLIRMGTNDVLVDRGASVIRHGSSNLAYYPYGEEQGGASANDRAKFATYTRDASTGLDYAWNRMYKTEWGRFTAADPSAAAEVKARTTWNRFEYGAGDPVNHSDSSGLSWSVIGFCPPSMSSSECFAEAPIGEPSSPWTGGSGWGGGGIQDLIAPRVPIGGGSIGGIIAPILAIPLPWIIPGGWDGFNDPECEIQLKYRDVNIVPGDDNHSFLAVVADDGLYRYIEGQPSVSLSNPVPRLVAESGQIFKDDKQWNAKQSGFTMRGTSVCRRVDSLFKKANEYNSDPVTYLPLGPNCNSLTRYLLSSTRILGQKTENGQLYFPQPPDTRGWDTLIHGK